jgi:hypothetical protein
MWLIKQSQSLDEINIAITLYQSIRPSTEMHDRYYQLFSHACFHQWVRPHMVVPNYEWISWKPKYFPDWLVLQRDFILQRDFGNYNETLRFTLIGD